MTDFSAFSSRTIVRATLVMESALAVGSRPSLEATGTDMPVMKAADGRPFVPGSSVKGVVRFQTERLLRAINDGTGLSACDPLGAPCVPGNVRDELWRESNRDDQLFAEKLFQASCTACRIFGSPWFAGRLAFKDAYLANAEDLPVLTQVRDGVGIDRDLGAARSAIKYDFETVVPGARFSIEALGENLDPWEVGLLLAVLDMWRQGGIALGGKSTRGPGWGRLEGVTVQRVEASGLWDYLASGQAPTVREDDFRNAFRDRLRGGKSDA